MARAVGSKSRGSSPLVLPPPHLLQSRQAGPGHAAGVNCLHLPFAASCRTPRRGSCKGYGIKM